MSLAVESLSYRIREQVLLNDVSVSIEPGELVVLLGPNGAGKTTLLRLLSGELSAEQGRVLLDGKVLASYALQALACRRAVMTQSSAVVFDFAVDEILRMGWVAGSREARLIATREIVDSLELQPFLGRPFNRLSGGEQQRVQFARSLLQLRSMQQNTDSSYLLLDEPTSNLDVVHELMVLHHARDAADCGAGVIVVLHDLNLAARFADRVVLLNAGQIAAVGPVAEVFDRTLLSDVYRLPLEVEHHQQLDRLVVYS